MKYRSYSTYRDTVALKIIKLQLSLSVLVLLLLGYIVDIIGR